MGDERINGPGIRPAGQGAALSYPGAVSIQRPTEPTPDRPVVEKDGRYRKNVTPGIRVCVVQKKDQNTGVLTPGVIQEILTSSGFHPRGIKVRLREGPVGRVQKIEK